MSQEPKEVAIVRHALDVMPYDLLLRCIVLESMLREELPQFAAALTDVVNEMSGSGECLRAVPPRPLQSKRKR